MNVKSKRRKSFKPSAIDAKVFSFEAVVAEQELTRVNKHNAGITARKLGK